MSQPLEWTKNNGEIVGAAYVRTRLQREARRWTGFTKEERQQAIERIVTDRTRNGELVASLCRSFLDVAIAVRVERDMADEEAAAAEHRSHYPTH